MRPLDYLTAVLLLAGYQSSAAAQDVHPALQTALQQHCVACHQADDAEAGIRLDQLTVEAAAQPTWNRILRQVRTNQMPPPDASETDLDANARTEMVRHLVELLTALEAKAPSSNVIRRMNRSEYGHTIFDLLGVRLDVESLLPEDPPSDGFDNQRKSLTLSPLHIEQYLEAAEEAVEFAFASTKKSLHRTWHFEVESSAYPDRIVPVAGRDGRMHVMARVLGHGNSERNGSVIIRRQRWDSNVGFKYFQLPFDGEYIIRIHAAANPIPDRQQLLEAGMRQALSDHVREIDRMETEKEKRWVADQWETVREPAVTDHFGKHSIYEYGPPRMSATVNLKQQVGQWDVPDTQFRNYETVARLEHGELQLEVTNVYHLPTTLQNQELLKFDNLPRPELLVDWIEIEGPVISPERKEAMQRILFEPEKPLAEDEYIRKVLHKFMSRAFRRPVWQHEVDRMFQVFQQAKQVERNRNDALQVALVAILASPDFLLLTESPLVSDNTNESRDAMLSDFQIACRLSYFLWSSMPDDRLFELAQQQKLRDTVVLKQEVDRMLADPKSDRFADDFVQQWLGIRHAGSVRPDKKMFRRFDDHLLDSMKQEPTAFFQHLLQHDLSALNLLQSDFAVINQRLARFYGIPGVQGDHFRTVAVPDGITRGGVLTMSAMHLVTSNGTRTSPVKRGVWILERILDDPTPPPPPNVGDIAPGVPGIDKATVRQRLQMHRANSQCAVCHDKIDPLGFALENFDPIGAWRTQEGNGLVGGPFPKDPLVDANAILPNGTKINGVADLLTALRTDPTPFSRCLTEKMIIYALGRPLRKRIRLA
ncbi:MAG: DUF1592 domain-containing protein [Pirellulaceae bacterium]